MTKDQPMTKGNTPILTLSDHRVQANAEKLVGYLSQVATTFSSIASAIALTWVVEKPVAMIK